MAFTCSIKLPLVSDGEPLTGPITFVQSLAQPKMMIDKGTPLFTAKSHAGFFEVRSNMAGMLASLDAAAGVTLAEDVEIGRIWAEGEDIPYGKPYVLAVPVVPKHSN